jgi:hypothetical protein
MADNKILRYKLKISQKKAIEKICVHAMWGDHSFEPRPVTKSDVVKALLSIGIDPNKVAEECRNFLKPVPRFENLVSTTWNVSGTAEVKIVNETTGEVLAGVKGPGTLSMLSYMALFETACKARDSAVENASYSDIQTAIVQGIASIEAHINELALRWNQANPKDQPTR